MIGISALAVLPVLLGVGLALLPDVLRRIERPVRGVAALAALGAVFGLLLPEGWRVAGPSVLFWLALGFVLPVGFEAAAARVGRWAGEAAIAVGGLALHQVADGLEIGAAHRLGDDAVSVAGAVALHTLPLVAVLVRPDGAPVGVVVRRGAILVAATLAGLAGGLAATNALPHGEGWLPALLGGVLLHVLWHGLHRPPS